MGTLNHFFYFINFVGLNENTFFFPYCPVSTKTNTKPMVSVILVFTRRVICIQEGWFGLIRDHVSSSGFNLLPVDFLLSGCRRCRDMKCVYVNISTASRPFPVPTSEKVMQGLWPRSSFWLNFTFRSSTVVLRISPPLVFFCPSVSWLVPWRQTERLKRSWMPS